MIDIVSKAGDKSEENLEVINVFGQLGILVAIVEHEAYIHGMCKIMIRNTIVHFTQFFTELENLIKFNG